MACRCCRACSRYPRWRPAARNLSQARARRHTLRMGLLDRLINGINRVGGAIDDADEVLWVDRRFAQADRLAAEGVRNEGVLTGIKQRFDDNGTTTTIRLTWFDPNERSA